MSAELVKRESPVETWLHELPERKRSAALQYAAGERSIVTSFLYCSLLGMEASIDDYEAWAIQRWKKLDHRAILETEIMALHDDISEIRRAVEEGKIRMGDAPTKISYLSKELRGHIEHLSREVNMHDRRPDIGVTAKDFLEHLARDLHASQQQGAAIVHVDLPGEVLDMAS